MDYDTWKEENCEELFVTPEDDGYVHEDNLPDLDECRNALSDIIHMLYKGGELDCSTLDDRIGYMAVEFGVKMPDDDPTVVRRASKEEINRSRLQQWYVGYTRAHAELAHRR